MHRVSRAFGQSLGVRIMTFNLTVHPTRGRLHTPNLFVGPVRRRIRRLSRPSDSSSSILDSGSSMWSHLKCLQLWSPVFGRRREVDCGIPIQSEGVWVNDRRSSFHPLRLPPRRTLELDTPTTEVLVYTWCALTPLEFDRSTRR